MLDRFFSFQIFFCILYFVIECISGYEPPKPDLVELAKSYLDPESGGIGVWDGHNDLPMTYTYHDTMNQNLDKIDLYDSTLNFTETTIPWAKEGHLRGQFWSIYWSCKSNYKDGVQER